MHIFSLVCAPLLITIFSQNAPTQSLLRVVNGILDESIERKRGEIPHVSLFSVILPGMLLVIYRLLLMTNVGLFLSQRVVYLLRNVVQEIEHRIAIQADHIRNVSVVFAIYFHRNSTPVTHHLFSQQNSIIKTRENKYRSKIKALETLVNGTNEENEVTIQFVHDLKILIGIPTAF